MKQKIEFITDFLEKRFGERPIVHRAGRWATNSTYFDLLNDCGYVADCSVTPGMNMTRALGFTDNSHGSDYSKESKMPYVIKGTTMWEIPMTVRKNHMIKKDNNNGFKHRLYNIYRAAKGRGYTWLRPNGTNLEELIYLVDKIRKECNTEYIMFMLHTSEMMPGGSPTFRTEDSIEKMYRDVEKIFSMISDKYQGVTIREFGELLK